MLVGLGFLGVNVYLQLKGQLGRIQDSNQLGLGGILGHVSWKNLKNKVARDLFSRV